eukprot:TRINITY_DN960_c0_g2_i5.p2 TRINITY_DN960_c0_g2~~TRINITY_DN960_c0_g2_i5.p2  ORF type:complete len:177 (-),score=66.64 TRINITY_DN960_c0_g2_i5:89-619(-)
MTICEYQIVGRKKPTDLDPNPQVFRMRLFASNEVVAKSRFWYFMSQLKRVKRANGEILAVHKIFEKNPNTVKNYGVLIRYDSRTGTHSMYKEYRDTSRIGAIGQMYSEMAGRHRARKSSIQIVAVNVIEASKCRRASTIQFHKSNIRFPLVSRLPRASTKQLKSTFLFRRPNTFAG